MVIGHTQITDSTDHSIPLTSITMPSYLFWFFSTIMLIGGAAVIAFRNPVSSALSVVTCFVGLAGLFIGLSAFFVGVIQILVYTGAIMVLFLFIIMLLDLKDEQKRAKSIAPIAAGLSLVIAFVIQLIGVLSRTPDKIAPPLDADALAAAASHRPDFPKPEKSPPRSTTAAFPTSISSATRSSPTTTCRSKSSACSCSSPPSASSSSPKSRRSNRLPLITAH